MKVILKKEVAGLGKEKDIVEVAAGYARNFLITSGLALKATPGNVQIINEERKRESKRKKKEKECFQKLAQKIESLSVTIKVLAGEDNKLYGSVTSQDIADALAREGIQIDKRKIVLDESIRSLGIYHVSIKLHPEVKVSTKVWVIKE